MIKAGTPREKVAEILKASGVKAGDRFAYYDSTYNRYGSVWINPTELENGCPIYDDYLYVVRLEQDGPRRIELIEPVEKTLRRKMGEEVARADGYYLPAGVSGILDICAKVAEEHFGGDKGK